MLMGKLQGSFKDQLMALNEQADRHIKAIIAASDDIDSVHRELRFYLQCRFILDDEDMDTDDLKELADRSISRMLAKHQNEDLDDLSSGCMGESSATTKKILFMMTLRRKLDVDVDAERLGSALTVRQLAEIVSDSLPIPRDHACSG